MAATLCVVIVTIFRSKQQTEIRKTMNGMDDVERFMKQMAAAEAGAPVPSASAVWWRAELRRPLALERATRPMRIADGVACALCTVAAARLAAQLGAFGVLQVFVR